MTRRKLTVDMRVGLARRYGGRPEHSVDVDCYWCGGFAGRIYWFTSALGRSTEIIRFSEGIHVDHLIPIARGGRDVLSNLVLACVSCNLERGAQPAPWQPRRLREHVA